MKFVFFSVSENGENGLSDEGADGAMPSPGMFGLEPPLDVVLEFCYLGHCKPFFDDYCYIVGTLQKPKLG